MGFEAVSVAPEQPFQTEYLVFKNDFFGMDLTDEKYTLLRPIISRIEFEGDQDKDARFTVVVE